MSFFDDEDDAIEEVPRRSPRAAGGARPRSSSAGARAGSRGAGARRASSSDPAVERRRWIAGGVLVIVVILMIVLISSCQARNTKTSLEDYNNSVSSLINRSDATGRQVFSALSSGKGGAAIQTALAAPLQAADTELSDARNLSVPGQMAAAQSHVLLALQMRADGISQIADHVASASSSGAGATQAVKQVTAGAARFYASDVTYIDYAAPEIAGALHGDGIPVGGNSSIQINPGQFLSDLGWLQQSYVATKLGATTTTPGGGHNESQPGLHGDGLNSTSVGSTTLSPSGTNTVAGSPAPTFTLSVTNGGNFTEYNVGCSVSVSGGPSGKGMISSIAAGATTTCNVTLPSTVTAGTYQVTASIAKVPLETNVANNSQTYSVQFQ